MIFRLLKLPFRLAGALFALVFVGGMLEFFGLLLYLQWAHEAAFTEFTSGGFGPAELVDFLLATPDRIAVAAGIAVLAVFLVVFGESGSGGGIHDGGDFGGGGFGGDGGGGGDGGE